MAGMIDIDPQRQPETLVAQDPTPEDASCPKDEVSLNYRDAGVDIDAGNALVERIKPLAAATSRPGVLAGLGGFGALFELPWDRFRQPVLVSSTDGVGTKLKLAIEVGRHDTVGIDLVAMCANDVLVCGAEPLFFLDYYATGRLDLEVASAVIGGIAEGCRRAGCCLSGGETAEMPGMYAPGDYDLAGFCVGIAEKAKLLGPQRVRPGDALIALAASGPHSNGYSLIRKVLEVTGADLNEPLGASTLGASLLAPTRIYVRPLCDLMQSIGHSGGDRSRFLAQAGGFRLARVPGRHRRARDAAHLQLRGGAGRLPPRAGGRPRLRALAGRRRDRLAHRPRRGGGRPIPRRLRGRRPGLMAELPRDARLPVLVLVSGNGSNLQALMDAAAADLPILIRAVISNEPHAFALERARRAGIETRVLDHRDCADRQSYDRALAAVIDAFAPGLILLAGFMRILTPAFVARFRGRMLNIHPSLLPKFRGLHTHERVLAAGERRHGASVHFVTEELDGGPVVVQAEVPVEPGDEPEGLAARVLAQEHVIYPLAVRWFAAGRLALDTDGRARLDGAVLERPIRLVAARGQGRE